MQHMSLSDGRDAGQMSAYLSAVDDQLRNENDKPTIGLIFCKTKDNVFVEYVLRNFNCPIGVAKFEVKLVEKLPKDLKSSLPTVEEIEAELSVMPTEKKKKTRENLMDAAITKRVDAWLAGPFDEKTKHTLQDMIQKNPSEVINAFYKDLEFGTGGLRGIMGIGTNRMNSYTVKRSTQGLANYLLKQFPDEKISVFIGFDSRHNSALFALDAARVFAGNGISVFLLRELRPTPFISFGCRQKKCRAAVMITASHNPAEYNGYKVYWSDGAQIVPPHDLGIMQEIEKISSTGQIKTAEETSSLIERIDGQLDQAYIEAIRKLQLLPEQNKKEGSHLKITYTSLHGTGITLTPKALQDWGFTTINYVESQIIPDGDFPTVKYPNPEYREALSLGIEKLMQSHYDILLATDPDADRLGVVVNHRGEAVILSGNEIACLCVEYLGRMLSSLKKMPKKPAFITTIVSSELFKTIATSYHADCFEVLTGFKYIGELIHLFELHPGSHEFLFGAEESYGYLVGTHSRDKDAVVSSCLLAEIALYAKGQGQTLIDFLHSIYQKYGLFREKQLSLEFSAGKEGMEAMQKLMHKLRDTPMHFLLDEPVTSVEDYLKLEKTDLLTHTKEPLTLPKSDVLLYRASDRVKLVIRPSGTEPKVKLYAGVKHALFSSIQQGIEECDAKLDALLSYVKKALT